MDRSAASLLERCSARADHRWSTRRGSFVAGATSEAASRAGIGTPTALGLATLSGLAFATGFPPLSWSFAPWLALAPLLVACAALSPRRAAVAGMCWAVAVAACAAAFLPAMLSGYFGLAAIPSWLATVVIVGGLHGVSVSGYAAWVAWLARRRAANPLLLAAGWVACEFVRAHGELGSPWALAAYSQIRWTPLIQIADLAGPYGIGMLIAGVNAGLAAWLVPALRGRRPWLSTATIATALLSTILYGHWRLHQRFTDGAGVRVAVVQAGAPTVTVERPARLARHLALSRDAAVAGARLIVWPESAIDAYLQESSPMRDAVLRLAGERDADLILGGPHYTPSLSSTRYHNSAYLIRDGRVAARYDKHRLVPFAEDDRFSWLSPRGGTTYTPGVGTFVLPGTALHIGSLLCVEAMFPDLAREAVRQGADVLVNLSNDGWFGHADPARQQLDIATLRAVESRRYLIRAAATGFSAVVDPYGRTRAQSGFGTHEVITATVHASQEDTPYVRWGDAFAWLVIASAAGMSLWLLLAPTPTHRRRLHP